MPTLSRCDAAMIQQATFDRRSVLKLLSTSPLLMGAQSLLAPQDKQGKQQPSWFKKALRQARIRRAPVVAIVVPDTSTPEIQTKTLARQKTAFKKHLQALYNTRPTKPGRRSSCRENAWFTIRFEDRLARLAVYLQLLLDSRNPAMQELLLEAVWVCAPAKLLGAEKSEVVVTLDSNGRRTGGAILDLSDEDDVIQKLQHLLHGKDDVKLKKRAQASRTEEITKAIEHLASRTTATRNGAVALFLENLEPAMAALIEARHHHKDGAVCRQIAKILATAHDRARKHDYRGVLPFGTKLEKRSVYDPCPPCGMAKVPEGTRKMLKLLGK